MGPLRQEIGIRVVNQGRECFPLDKRQWGIGVNRADMFLEQLVLIRHSTILLLKVTFASPSLSDFKW